jgi:hypothetical protein
VLPVIVRIGRLNHSPNLQDTVFVISRNYENRERNIFSSRQ